MSGREPSSIKGSNDGRLRYGVCFRPECGILLRIIQVRKPHLRKKTLLRPHPKKHTVPALPLAVTSYPQNALPAKVKLGYTTRTRKS